MGMAKMSGPPKMNKKKSNNTDKKGQRITTLNWQAKKRKCPVNLKFVDYPLKQCRGIIHSSVWQTFSTWRGEWVILCPSGVECKLVSFFFKGQYWQNLSKCWKHMSSDPSSLLRVLLRKETTVQRFSMQHCLYLVEHKIFIVLPRRKKH